MQVTASSTETKDNQVCDLDGGLGIPFNSTSPSCYDSSDGILQVNMNQFTSSNGPISATLENGMGFSETNQTGLFENLAPGFYTVIISDTEPDCTIEYNYTIGIPPGINTPVNKTFTCDGTVGDPRDIPIDGVYDSPPGVMTYYDHGSYMEFIGFCREVIYDDCEEAFENTQVVIQDILDNITNLCCDDVDPNNQEPRIVERRYITTESTYNIKSTGTQYITIEGINCPPPIPTLSQWGIIVMILTFFIFGIIRLKQLVIIFKSSPDLKI